MRNDSGISNLESRIPQMRAAQGYLRTKTLMDLAPVEYTMLANTMAVGWRSARKPSRVALSRRATRPVRETS